MKARMRNSGEILAVYEAMPGKYAVMGTNGPLMSSIDLEIIPEVKEDKTDWVAFRKEAAKEILCAMVSGGYGHGRENEQAALAVKYAEELIKQLKDDPDNNITK